MTSHTETQDTETDPYLMYSKLFNDIQARLNPQKKGLANTCSSFTENSFYLSYTDLCQLTANSYQDEKKPFRYLTGDFMRIFEQQMDLIENFKTGIQKRNNILYLDPTRSSTVYLRVNGDCKYCPKHARVRYVFTIRNRPSGSEALIRVNVKLRGTHVHEGSGKAKGWRERLGEDGETGLDFHVGDPSSCALKEKKETNEYKPEVTENTNCYTLNTTLDSPVSQHKSMNLASGANNLLLLSKQKRSQLNSAEKAGPIKRLKPKQLLKAGANKGPSGAGLFDTKGNGPQVFSQLICGKMMSKLDQVISELRHVSNQVFELEKKLDTLESMVQIF